MAQMRQQALKNLGRQILGRLDMPGMVVDVSVQRHEVPVEDRGQGVFVEGARPAEQDFVV
jgi:hypothetical protein